MQAITFFDRDMRIIEAATIQQSKNLKAQKIYTWNIQYIHRTHLMKAAHVRVDGVFQASHHAGDHGGQCQNSVHNASDNRQSCGQCGNDEAVESPHNDEQEEPRQYLQRLQWGFKPGAGLSGGSMGSAPAQSTDKTQEYPR